MAKPDVKIKAEIDLKPLENEALPGLFGEIVATHHPKIGHSKVPVDQFVRAMRTVHKDTDTRIGVCSVSIDSHYPLGSICSGPSVGRSMALATDLGRDEPLSILGTLAAGENSAGLNAAVWHRLKTAFDALRDTAPKTVTQFERLAFFEGIDDEVLITPVSSVKIIHELNYRVRQRRDKYFGDRADETKTGRRLLPRVVLPVGGANPQNVGYIVNKFTRNTLRGGVTLLTAVCPVDRRSAAQKRLSILRGSQSFSRVAQVGQDVLIEYGKRSAIDIDLATHHAAEYRQAIEIAHQFLSLRDELSEILATRPIATVTDQFKSLDHDELRWLDPRIGQSDAPRLARRFATAVKSRIERLLRAKPAEDGATSVFILSDRSVETLCAAFEECL